MKVDAGINTLPSWNLRNIRGNKIAEGMYLAVLRLKKENHVRAVLKEKLVLNMIR